MRRSGVLLVSASTGTGHVRAAEALRQALAGREPALTVRHVDLLELAPGWVRTLYGTGYEVVAARAPRLWKGIYRLTDGREDSARWGALARKLLFQEFRRLLVRRRWDAVVCTHFLPCQLAAGRPDLPPFSLVVTDFTLHRYWVQPGVRRYFTATDALAAELVARVPGARVTASGIPVAPGFGAGVTREEARGALGIEPARRVALVMGGGLGIGVEEAVEAALETTPPDALLLAVCGKNEAARARLEARGVAPERLRVHGFVRGIERMMAAADVVATKPGGLTTSETLAMGRPLVLIRPIPGAEEGNTRALAAEGAALAAQDPAALREAFGRVFTEPGLLPRLSAAARRLGRPDAALAIADAVLSERLVRAVAA